MCNALKHPPGCTCGWGGDGHLGKRTHGNIYSNGVRVFDTRRLESYIIPNAKCPVCGALVFFYKSEHGGRVFFDELGPPWPKHPCTNNSKYKHQSPTPTNSYSLKQATCQKNGWFPVVVNNLYSKSIYAFSIERIDTYLTVKIDTMIYGSSATELTKGDLIIFAKRKEKDCFILGIFAVNDEIVFELDIKYQDLKLDAFFNSQTKNIYMQI